MRKRTTEEFKEIVYELEGDNYKVLGEYISTTSKILIQHMKCGHIYEVTPARFLEGTRCPKCRSSHKPKDEGVFKSELPEGYSLIGHYVNAKTKVLIRHERCGYEWYTNPSTIRKGHGCPKCANNIKKIASDYQIDLSDYEFLEEVNGSKEKVSVKHKKCGYIWRTRPNDLMSGYGCPRCGHINSKAEKEIVDYIKTIYSGEIIENSRDIIPPLELDIYIPALKIGFEYDGLYWHSQKDKNYHLIKTETCEDKGIRLWHIFANEWKEKPELLKKRIRHLILKDDKPIYGRKCQVKEISPLEKNDFLAVNHIQGADKSKINLGLFYDDELVAVMTFSTNTVSRNTRLKEGEIELSRYATLLGSNVIGGFGRLIKYFWEHFDYQCIYTYADRRYTNRNSNIYLKNNFKEIAISSPNYWIVGPKETLYHRFSFIKQDLVKKYGFPSTSTEDEMLNVLGLSKIYDCGTLRYLLTKPMSKKPTIKAEEVRGRDVR